MCEASEPILETPLVKGNWVSFAIDSDSDVAVAAKNHQLVYKFQVL